MRMSFRVSWVCAVALCAASPLIATAQVPVERVDTAMIEKIKEEGLQRSKVMETISYITDVHGPRLTGSPLTRKAGEWAKGRLTEYGLENATLEEWGPFGRGWTLEACSVNMVEPHFSQVIAYPKAWTPSTPKTVRGEPIYLEANTKEDLEKYRGKLGRAIVLISPPREVKALFEPPATRQTDSELLALSNAGPAAQRRRRNPDAGGPPAGGPPREASANAAPADPAAAPAATPAATPAGAPAQPSMADMRSSMQLQSDKWQLVYDEGAAVVLEPGRGDGGTVFVAQATMPRLADPNRDTRSPSDGGNPFSRGGPRPWATDPPTVLPQLVLAAEHYNRLVRMVQKEAHPKLEIDIETRYHDGDLNSFNIIAEIPGTDLKDEIVMLGGHFDSWHAGTGATDNAIGCGVALEAVRILKAIDAKPRRTIRIALWTGEEQGLYGSRAYVADHFGAMQTPSRGGPGSPGFGGGEGARRPIYELKAEHEKFSSYFNLDNGTGKIRGIYLQGNEAVRPIFRAWLAPFADMGATTITSSNTGGTDHQ
ncbi:MAG: M20/M25/M40 family metallo-hydrolase, partial [Pirellulaceae bacterium]|nr:M20/M25/M40 family metallo-hydrolase [Pirellulaceae bacterium]